MKKKGYITVVLLLLGGYAVAKLIKNKPKLKGSVKVVEPTKGGAYSVVGSTVYADDRYTPIYTFKTSLPLSISNQDDIEYMFEVQFKANGVIKTGWIAQNEVYYKF